MRKFIFTESQIKNILDDLIQEEINGVTPVPRFGTVATAKIDDSGRPILKMLRIPTTILTVVSGPKTGRIDGKPITRGMKFTPQSKISLPLSTSFYTDGDLIFTMKMKSGKELESLRITNLKGVYDVTYTYN